METDKHKPHVFEELDLMPFSLPLGVRGEMDPYVPPPTPAGRSRVCGVCGLPKSDRVHIEGEAEADAESPRWG